MIPSSRFLTRSQLMDTHHRTLVKRFLIASCLCILIFGGPAESARAGQLTLQATVAGTDQPWNFTPGGLNTNFQYGINDGTGPLVLSAADGFSFAPGGSFTVTYVSGLVSAGPGFYPFVDANGDTQSVFNNNPGSSGKVAPSFYMDPATYPIYLVELVGTFANSSGAIVGTPFALGDGPTTITVPTGATQLQLGVNDDIYHDNAGSFTVDVSGPAFASVPEPTSMIPLGTSFVVAVAFYGRRRRRVS
jgi:hypothetical protein